MPCTGTSFQDVAGQQECPAWLDGCQADGSILPRITYLHRLEAGFAAAGSWARALFLVFSRSQALNGWAGAQARAATDAQPSSPSQSPAAKVGSAGWIACPVGTGGTSADTPCRPAAHHAGSLRKRLGTLPSLQVMMPQSV
jgi:hypothetical protein